MNLQLEAELVIRIRKVRRALDRLTHEAEELEEKKKKLGAELLEMRKESRPPAKEKKKKT